jgi:hypothetical protein
MARSGGGSTPVGVSVYPSAMNVDPIAGGILYCDDQGPNTSVESRKGSQLCSMFYSLTAVLMLGPRGFLNDPQNTAR